jgi:hypothetical protein
MAEMDLPAGTGMVGSRVRFMVTSSTLETLGEVHPIRNRASVTNDTGANIMRSLRGVSLRQNDMREINPNTDRLTPVWEYADGSHAPGFTGWPCGVFMFGSRIKQRGSLHTMHNAALMDQGYQLDQDLMESYGVGAHEMIYPHLVKLMVMGGITEFDIDPTDARIKDPLNWPIGTRLVQVIRDLCRLAVFYPPWFNNAGRGQLRAQTELTEEGAHVYDLDTPAGVVVRDTIHENEQLLDAPNVYVVVSNGPTQSEIVARAFVDPRLPYSIENIKYARPKVIRLQGLRDSDHAQQIADSFASMDSNQFYVAEFDTAPNPRHDTFESVRYDGLLFRELRNSLELRAGGRHSHFCTRGPYQQEGL